MMSKGILPEEWTVDHWAPHNLRFGMLLGYPGQAISSICWTEATQEEDGKHQTITASMPFQGLFCGAYVSYDYVPELKFNPIIQQHQAQWSNVLRSVYKVFPRSRLLGMSEFSEEYNRFKLYDEPA
jgi:hypothetical protein